MNKIFKNYYDFGKEYLTNCQNYVPTILVHNFDSEPDPKKGQNQMEKIFKLLAFQALKTKISPLM